MYLIDFFKRLGRVNNIPIIIYLVLNVAIIAGISHLLIGSAYALPFWASFLIGIALYLLSLVIALSPIGEWILRKQNGCKEIDNPDLLAYISPIFDEVYQRAKMLDPSIPDDVRLFVKYDADPNAFATGRKTVCITTGLLNCPVGQIKATLAHEFGHLAHKDTDLILVVAVGNMIVTAFITFVRLMIELFRLMMLFVSLFIGGSEGSLAAVFTSIYSFMISLFVSGLTWVWTKIGTLLVMKSSRSNEYAADEFSYQLGYGYDLCGLLDSFSAGSSKGLFANLVSSHPDKDLRIQRLVDLQTAANDASMISK